MIINTGQRTDIPAFYSKWFANRLRAGFVCVRNPYDPRQVSRYRLDPSVVDVIGFCTKNPAPMFEHMALLREYGQYWFVTVTPYGWDIEPNVPDKHRLLDDFRRLSDMSASIPSAGDTTRFSCRSAIPWTITFAPLKRCRARWRASRAPS